MIPCPLCAQEYDYDELHREVALGHYKDIQTAESMWIHKGCTSLWSVTEHNHQTLHNDDAWVARALFETLRHDFDGVAAEWEDYLTLQGAR